MATTYRDIEHEGHRYRQKDVVRGPSETGAWGVIGRRRPVRETSYQPEYEDTPKIHGTSTHSTHQLKAPVVIRPLSPREREDQRKRNLALGVASGAGAGKLALSVRNSYKTKEDPNRPRGIFGQMRRNYEESVKNPQRLSRPEAKKLARTLPWNLMPHTRHIRNEKVGDAESVVRSELARRRLGQMAPVSLREAGRSYARNFKGNALYVGGGIAAGGALAVARNNRLKRHPEYATAYSTRGMEPLQKPRSRR